MIRFVGVLMFALLAFAAAWPVSAQNGDAVQLRLTNRMTAKVDYYIIPEGGKPTFAGSIEPGAIVDIEATEGQGYVFAIDRVPFQKYTARAEAFQGLTLAPQGQQKPPVLANARQKPASGAKTVKPAPVDETAAEAPSEDGMAWTFSRSADSAGGKLSALTYWVPETDNVQFAAVCGEADPLPRVMLSADMSRFQNGDAASVRFLASGFNTTIKGVVLRSESGEGQEGIDMVIDAAEPIWQEFSARSAMNYSVQGQPPLRLSLSGAAPALQNFLRDCGQYAKGGGATAAGGVVSDATQLFADGNGAGAPAAPDSCAALDGMVSKNGGKNVSVEFVNRTDEYRVVLWIDFDGTPVEYAQLEPGQSFQVETSSTHPWMATDGPGNCIEKFMPKAGQIVIARKSPGFGDE